MKIKTKEKKYNEVMELPVFKHKKPKKQSAFFRKLISIISVGALKKADFECEQLGMDKIEKGQPCLVLMNHSSFIDLMIVGKLLKAMPYHIVCTYDGFVGKDKLMRKIGCIPTRKFTNDISLIKDMLYTTKELKESIVMYPEASYSFDGTQTPIPTSLGKCLKLLKVPVIMITTYGAFARDPLYNNLQVRKVPVSAKMECILSTEDIEEKSVKELNAILKEQFTYDHFKWQQDNQVKVDEPFRADCLNRVLYKCPKCQSEGKMIGKGIQLTCNSCGKIYELNEYGYMQAIDGETEYEHIPDWYRYQRECVKQEIIDQTYNMELAVDIYMMVNTDCIYKVGEGRLKHSVNGFELTGCDGELNYTQSASSYYSLYSDFYWYEIGDMICIGDENAQYYCFPKIKDDVVAKARLATEELYKIASNKK